MKTVEIDIKTLRPIRVEGLMYQYFAGQDGHIYCKKRDKWVQLNNVESNKKDKYYGVYLAFKSGRKKFHYIHKLVTNAFHGDPKIKGWKIISKNGNTKDTRPSNLVWRLKKDLSLYDILYEDEWMMYQKKLDTLIYISEMQKFNEWAVKKVQSHSELLLNKGKRKRFIEKLLK